MRNAIAGPGRNTSIAADLTSKQLIEKLKAGLLESTKKYIGKANTKELRESLIEGVWNYVLAKVPVEDYHHIKFKVVEVREEASFTVVPDNFFTALSLAVPFHIPYEALEGKDMIELPFGTYVWRDNSLRFAPIMPANNVIVEMPN